MMRRFGLIGKTLKHSFSKKYFTEKFAREGLHDCSYENFELESVDDLPALLTGTAGLRGLNVTIPYKEQITRVLTDADDLVSSIGACNCIKIDEGKLFGFNTDAVAFERVLLAKLQSHHTSALVLGTGGASKAVQYVLKKLGLHFLAVSRNKKGLEITYEDLHKDLVQRFTVIINTTPLGMYPTIDSAPPIPYQALTSNHLLFDLVYNPSLTQFLKTGKDYGASVMNGYEMLVEQAEESWRLWNQ